jgi:hypothetical protein
MSARIASIIQTLHTPEHCRALLNSPAAREDQQLSRAVFARLCELEAGQRSSADPFVSAVWGVIAGYEQLLFEDSGKRLRANRLRGAIARKGEYRTVLDLMRKKKRSDSFTRLMEAGGQTLEHVVVEFADRFPADLVSNCREVLSH